MGHAELTGFVAGLAPGLEPVAVLVHLGHAGVNVSITDVGVPGLIPCHVGDLTEHPVHGGQWRLGMLERLGTFVRGFLLAAEDHNHAAFGVELDDHVRTLVGDPDVIFGIDFDGMAEGPGVQIVADLADELAVGSELEKLGGSGAVSWSGGIAAR
jgi:hypothetical protein